MSNQRRHGAVLHRGVFTKSQPKNSFLVRQTGKKVASNLKDEKR
jgi:hypothetical protein